MSACSRCSCFFFAYRKITNEQVLLGEYYSLTNTTQHEQKNPLKITDISPGSLPNMNILMIFHGNILIFTSSAQNCTGSEAHKSISHVLISPLHLYKVLFFALFTHIPSLYTLKPPAPLSVCYSNATGNREKKSQIFIPQIIITNISKSLNSKLLSKTKYYNKKLMILV